MSIKVGSNFTEILTILDFILPLYKIKYGVLCVWALVFKLEISNFQNFQKFSKIFKKNQDFAIIQSFELYL
jgi:hypothetical protein